MSRVLVAASVAGVVLSGLMGCSSPTADGAAWTSSSSSSSSGPSSSTAASPSLSSRPPQWPNADTTGMPAGVTPRKLTGYQTIRKNGTVLENFRLSGSLDVYADNVTIRNCEVISTTWWGINLREGYANLTVENCDIHGNGRQQMQYAVKNAGEGWITIRGNDIHTCSNCIDTPVGLIEGNYVHDPKYFAKDHIDMIMSEGGPAKGYKPPSGDKVMVIRGNTVVNTLDQTGAIALFPDWSAIHDVLIEGNHISGGGYSIYGGGAPPAPDERSGRLTSNVVIRNNTFSRKVWPRGGKWGPVAYFEKGVRGNVWSGNVWTDGKPIKP